MIPVKFPEVNMTFAAGQPQYLPLPAHRDVSGCVTTRWKMSWGERLRVLLRGEFWLQTLTFSSPLQPLKPTVAKPVFGPAWRD